MSSVLVASLSSGLIALFFAFLLIFASKVFRVETDERVEDVIGMLPGVNCGGCGFAGCAQFANALVFNDAAVNGCPVGGPSLATDLASYLGKTFDDTGVRTRAYIFCQGHSGIAVSNQEYLGAKSCVGVAIAGGNKECSYGCVGYFDCLTSCNFGAIVIDDKLEIGKQIPTIVEDKCTSCGACVKACPLNLIEIHPVDKKYHVYCKSRDKGPIAKKACSKACIACNICIKNTEEGGMYLERNLAVINYDNYSVTEESVAKCPTKSITGERANSI